MKISVIIPVYNKAEYVGACLENTLQQDFDDFEVICVNDGSTDGSGEICDQWAAKDNRIKVFHTENGGVTAARRKGVEQAKGKYIVFVDADDQLLPKAIKTLYNAIEQTQADEVIGRFVLLEQDGTKKESPLLYNGNITDQTPLITAIISNKNMFPILWGLICRKEIVEDCLDTPREIIEGEDLMMQLKILMKHPHVHFISDCVYLYNEDIPNNRKRSLGHEILYDKLLKEILAPEWEKYSSAYVFHQIKQYEELIIRRVYSVRKTYYKKVIPSPLPKGIPLFRRLVWFLPPFLGRMLVWLYRKTINILL